MSTKIGHFEILSELSKSATGAVYKANDPQTSQTVALKAIQLSAFGDHAAELQQCLVEEVETTKVLSHSNLSPVFGAGEFARPVLRCHGVHPGQQHRHHARPQRRILDLGPTGYR